MNRVAARFFRGFGASSFGQGVTAATQLAALPIFLACWDINTYGSWVLMMALPAPFALADFGMNTVAGTRMNILLVQGRTPEARKVFHSALMFTCIALSIICFAGITAIETSTSDFLSQTDVRTSLVFILLDTLLVVFGGLFEASFRANGQFALGVFVLNLARAAEWFGSVIGALAFRTLIGAAMGLFVGRLSGTVLLYFIARMRFPDQTWRFKDASREEIKSMLAPALAYMGVQAGSVCSLQGLTLVVAHIGGPVEVAIFSAYRTLSRLLVQFTALVGRPLLPEVSRYLGEQNLHRVSQLYRYAVTGTFLLVILIAGVLSLLGSPIIHIWGHGRLPFRQAEFSALLAYGVLGASWQVSLAVLAGINRHFGFATAYLLISICGLAGAYVAGSVFAIPGVLTSLVLSEAAVSIAAIYSCRNFWRGGFAIPFRQLFSRTFLR